MKTLKLKLIKQVHESTSKLLIKDVLVKYLHINDRFRQISGYDCNFFIIVRTGKPRVNCCECLHGQLRINTIICFTSKYFFSRSCIHKSSNNANYWLWLMDPYYYSISVKLKKFMSRVTYFINNKFNKQCNQWKNFVLGPLDNCWPTVGNDWRARESSERAKCQNWHNCSLNNTNKNIMLLVHSPFLIITSRPHSLYENV